MYRIIGYYICERIAVPEWLNRSGMMLSVSECFGGIHPRLDTCFFQNDYIGQKERDAYRKRWGFSDEKAMELEREIGVLLKKGLAEDGCFQRLSDARHFYDSYFSKGSCILVSVSTREKYFDILKDELPSERLSTNCLVSGVADENELLGFDILGWDIGSFHTFLCNRLQEMLPDAKFNGYGLLENTFEETAAFSARIQGYGEPVLWVPCRIGKCV